MRVTVFTFTILFAATNLAAQESKPPKSEIDVLYEQDQADREGNIVNIDWVQVDKRDASHRQRVRELLADGALTSGKDFEKAAFIFQHGNQPDDFLFAHILAMTAMSKGNQKAKWIAAATLDRYLQKIGRAQVLGTQFDRTDSQPWTQEPFDRTMVSESLRKELGVPPVEEQAKNLADLNKDQQASPK